MTFDTKFLLQLCYVLYISHGALNDAKEFLQKIL